MLRSIECDAEGDKKFDPFSLLSKPVSLLDKFLPPGAARRGIRI
jgi:hypothetical protein